jgi:gluconolactonase
MPELQQVRVVADGLAFPEGPVAMPDGSVIVVEIMAGRVTRVGPDGHKSLVSHVGGGPNGAGIGPDGHLYVCNNGGMTKERIPGCLQRVDLESGAVEVLYRDCEGRPLVAPNDLVFDDTGGMWFTDLRGDAIFYATADGSSIRRVLTGVPGPNGIGLSPDGAVVYWAQTYTRQVHRRRVVAPGVVEESPVHSVRSMMQGQQPDPWTLVVGLPGSHELDSLAVDSAGLVCVGTLIDSGITVVDPADGSWTTHRVPAPLVDGAVTNICFGGDDGQTAYITCSITGRLLSCRWPRPGLRLAFP